MSKRKPTDDAGNHEAARRGPPTAQDDEEFRGWRETIESIVVAIILALLFRTFEAEAFVIPTGSMATTLMGRHKDVECNQCGAWYQMGATEDIERGGRIDTTICPSCGYKKTLDPESNLDEGSFTGDRILVNKFAYALGEPQRWDVFVFRYPGNAKQNYIKRLVGLPNETLRIQHGDIYTQRHDDPSAPFVLERKPPDKVLAMLQLVHDSQYLPTEMMQAGLPPRWQPSPTPGPAAGGGWQVHDEGRRFSIEPTGEGVAWLRYRHLLSSQAEWVSLLTDGKLELPGRGRGALITDFSAYNTVAVRGVREAIDARMGLHWVGDLAIEAEVTLQKPGGKIWLECVEGGRHYRCAIDTASGQASLSIDGGQGLFEGDAGGENGRKFRTASTSLSAAGSYRLRLANVDDQLLLWVNDGVVDFDAPTTFTSPPDLRPQTSESDPGDLQPLAIGSEGAALDVTNLRVWRDIYYIAVDHARGELEYDPAKIPVDQYPPLNATEQNFDAIRALRVVLDTFHNPTVWGVSPIWQARQAVDFRLEEDQFFPMGDNSAQSQDARVWYNNRGWSENFVRREMLIGKAFVVYWPHGWHSLRLALPSVSNGVSWEPVPLYPNWRRISRIR